VAFLGRRADAITALQISGNAHRDTDAYSLTASIAERYPDPGS
jgi:hypothetical protein